MKALLSSGVLLAVLSMPAVGQEVEDAAPPAPAAPATRPATTQPSGPTAAEIGALIKQLADAAKSAEAKQKLITIGEPARDQIEKLSDRKLADEILSAIDMNRVANGTRITLKVKDAPIDEVLKQITRQMGVPIRMFNRAAFGNRGNNAEPQLLTLEYNDQPFWDVMRDLCEKAGVGPYNDGQQRRGMMLAPPNFGGNQLFNSPSYTSGAALCLMSNLSRNTKILFGPDQQPEYNFNASMTVMLEPKVRIGSWYSSPIMEEAVDDKGNSLLPKDPPSNASPTVPTAGMYRQSQNQASVSVALTYPAANPGTKIAKLRGKARVNVTTRSELVEVNDISKEQTRKASNGARIVVRSVKPQTENENNRQWTVQVSYYREGSDIQRFMDMVQSPTLRLVDANGRDLRYQPTARSDNNENEANQTLTFFRYSRNEGNEEDVSEPARVIWEVSIDSKEISIPFEFTDLPMP
jgi:hypothetical protein